MPEDSKEYKRRYMRERYRQNKEKIRQHKLDAGCADCGYREHHAALEFDHREGVKSPGQWISRMMSYPLATIMLEIEKCDVVCGNCHRIRTFDRLQEKLKAKDPQ